MRILAIFLLCLSSCSSVSHRGSADFSAAEASLIAAESKANPEAKAEIRIARAQVDAAKKACDANWKSLDECVRDKNEAIAKAEYWKAKQRKALKEIWIWRGAALVAILAALRGPIFWLLRKFVGIPW